MRDAGERAYEGGEGGRRCTGPDRVAWPLRPLWALLALLPPVLCFVATSAFLNGSLKALDAANRSIAENGGPCVVALSAEQADLRQVEVLALRARPASVREDRATIAGIQAEADRADAAYRATEQYLGERDAYARVREDRARFRLAVDRLLAGMEGGRPPDENARADVSSSADALSASTRDLVRINADEIVRATATAAGLRRRALWLSGARALSFAVVVAGALWGFWSARRDALLAEELRRLDQQRADDLDAFAGRVAHDLRDVLGVVLMRAAMAQKAETREDWQRLVGQIVEKARRMGEILTALLEFARSAGRPTPGARSEVEPVVQQVVAEVQPLAAEAGAEIVVEPMPAVVVACDAAVLSVVLSNLVRNAVKYITRGRGDLRRITLRAHDAGVRLCFEVEDTGPGLPLGAEARVFEPLVRLPEAAGKPGIGLGLATVKRYVEANGGEVGVVSPPGAGARFWFTLPRAS